MLLTRFVRIQLIVFAVVTVVALAVLTVYYLRVPQMAGIGQYTLHAQLPRSGGLYPTANVTYRGTTIGKVTEVEPTEHDVLTTLSIDDHYKIPVDAVANVHSVSAIGEQYLDLVSITDSTQYLMPGQTITQGTVPSEIGPVLDATNNALAALPKDKISSLLDETSTAVGGLGPRLQRLIDSTQAIVGDVKTNVQDINDIIENAGPILNSQVVSRDAIGRWSANLNTLGSQAVAQDQHLRAALRNAAPTADAVNSVFTGVRDALPQTFANAAIVFDMLKRYHQGIQQGLVILPQLAAVIETGNAPYQGTASLDLSLAINNPPPCLTGFLPASQWRSPADTSAAPLPENTYCKIPKDFQGNAVRGARNYPCVDVPGKRAATPRECRSEQPYEPLGTNPWYGDPNQVLTCPAPGARCDQPVKPGYVAPAPSVDDGINPLSAAGLPGPPAPSSDPPTPPASGSVTCTGQQPNPCTYTPAQNPAVAVYTPSSGEAVGPDGVTYTVGDSSSGIGDDGWKDMLAPVH